MTRLGRRRNASGPVSHHHRGPVWIHPAAVHLEPHPWLSTASAARACPVHGLRPSGCGCSFCHDILRCDFRLMNGLFIPFRRFTHRRKRGTPSTDRAPPRPANRPSASTASASPAPISVDSQRTISPLCPLAHRRTNGQVQLVPQQCTARTPERLGLHRGEACGFLLMG